MGRVIRAHIEVGMSLILLGLDINFEKASDSVWCIVWINLVLHSIQHRYHQRINHEHQQSIQPAFSLLSSPSPVYLSSSVSLSISPQIHIRPYTWPPENTRFICPRHQHPCRHVPRQVSSSRPSQRRCSRVRRRCWR